MFESLNKLWEQIEKTWSAIPASKRVAMALVSIITVGGILGVAWFSNRPDYKVLFAGLSGEDAAAVTQRLTELQSPFKLAQEGSAILVPADQALRLRLDMATAGLPSGGVVGYEIFDQSTFGMTEFVQRLNFRRALQGELSRTINKFREIQSSRVHIAIPEKRLFEKESAVTTASVVIKLASGKRLKKEKVAGISHLIASSVEGLAPEDVTVVDTEGNVLAGAEPTDDAVALSSTQLDYKTAIEKSMENRLSSMLENIVGQGKVVTRVSAIIDFSRVEKTEKKFDPDSQVARSEQRSENRSTGAQASFGVVGAESNLPGGAQAGSGSRPANNTSSQETTNYEINEVTTHLVGQVGSIQKLSIAVIVDGVYAVAKDGTREFSPRPDVEIARLTQLVRTAAGYDAERGDYGAGRFRPVRWRPGNRRIGSCHHRDR